MVTYIRGGRHVRCIGKGSDIFASHCDRNGNDLGSAQIQIPLIDNRPSLNSEGWSFMSEEDTMKKPMATKRSQARYEQNIKEIRDGDRNFFIVIGCTIASVAILGQLLAHVLVG